MAGRIAPARVTTEVLLRVSVHLDEMFHTCEASRWKGHVSDRGWTDDKKQTTSLYGPRLIVGIRVICSYVLIKNTSPTIGTSYLSSNSKRKTKDDAIN